MTSHTLLFEGVFMLHTCVTHGRELIFHIAPSQYNNNSKHLPLMIYETCNGVVLVLNGGSAGWYDIHRK